jgi:hypothetical protein
VTKAYIALAAVGIALAPAAASATDIDFGAVTSAASYVESGYRFTSSGGLFNLDGALAHGGTGPAAKITVSRVDGGLFTIGSIDVASQVGMMFAGNMDALFDFVLASGSVTSDYRVIDLGDTPTFTTIADFGTTQFRSFSIYSDRNSGTGQIKIDNLRVDAVGAPVPEPATWALMIAGFGAVGAAMRRRAKVKATVRFA